jgi:hypothetical protein
MNSFVSQNSAQVGADNGLICPSCRQMMRVARRTPHPLYGNEYELQTFICRTCGDEIQRSADRDGLTPSVPEKKSPTLWPHKREISDDEGLLRVVEGLENEGRWIDSFNQRLSGELKVIVKND